MIVFEHREEQLSAKYVLNRLRKLSNLIFLLPEISHKKQQVKAYRPFHLLLILLIMSVCQNVR